MRRLVVLLVTALVAALLFAATGTPAQARTASGKYQQQAFAATNANRAANGLEALRPHDCLKKAAVRQARLMAQREEMFHQDIGAVLEDCGLSTVGENVAYGYRSGKTVVNEGWMNSEGHRANILNAGFTLMGIGARKGHDGQWYVAQVFGRKGAGRVSGAVAERAAAPTVSMFIDERKPTVGEVYGVRGKVSPWSPGDRVTLQVLKEGGKRWHNVAATGVSRNGYHLVHQANTPGVRSYRILLFKSDTHPHAFSRAVTVTAYDWRPLKSLTPVAVSGFAFVDQAKIGDYTRRPALVTVGDGVHTIDFQLDGRCNYVDGYLGRVAGTGTPTGQAGWTVTAVPGKVSGDGAVDGEYSGWDLKDVGVLRLTATTSEGVVVGLGDPSLSCTF